MSDLDRLRTEYARRERELAGDDRYSLSNPAHRFMKSQLQKHVAAMLARVGAADLAPLRLLEIGCGNGNVLADFQSLGAQPQNLFGIDLLPMRLDQAHTNHPLFPLTCADGQSMPFPAHSFDLILQFTAFSSILDDGVKQNVGCDMLRLLRPSGYILWYDFFFNPVNPQTRGIPSAEIRRLFPDCRFNFQRVTLAPPIARRLASVSWKLCLFLENLKVFNTHHLVAIYL
jgi:SAM-dependent methyltransferase